MQTSNIPDWIDLNAEESTNIFFLVSSEHQLNAFNAIKNSTLPQEVITFLTEEGTFEKVLTKAGFGIGSTSGENMTLEGFAFKEVLGKYNEDFLNTIAPYVLPGSYIEMWDIFNKQYRWNFDGITCKKIYPRLVWN